MDLRRFFGGQNPQARSREALERKLDQVVYRVPGTRTDITIADAVESTLIMGASGSGKSSAIGKFIALSYLRAGFGFLGFCIKPDERKALEEYARLAGRSDDVLIFDEDSPLSFSFLEYEASRGGRGAGENTSMVNTLMSLYEQGQIYQSGGTAHEKEKFWNESLKRILSRSISLLRMTGQTISIENMRKLVSDSFDREDLSLYQRILSEKDNLQIDEVRRNRANDAFQDWATKNYMLAQIIELDKPERLETLDSAEVELVKSYWLKDLPKIAEKTRSIIIESFNGLVEPFLNGVLKTKFSGGLSPELNPENTYLHKKIIIVDFSVKSYGLSGVYANMIYKSTFMACMERRDVLLEEDPVPVCLYIDEHHAVVSSQDPMHQATLRSAMVAPVFISQNVHNYYMVLGPSMAESKTKSLIGNIRLKYFASNDDDTTNHIASELIGKHFIDVTSHTVNKDQSYAKSIQPTYHHKVSPDHFTTLKTGRRKNGYLVEAIVFKAGKIWDNDGTNFAVAVFDQRST